MLTSTFQAARLILITAAMVTLPSFLEGCSHPEKSVTLFEDVTSNSGLESYHGMTFGAYWGDFDGDGLPDLYVTNHLNKTGAKLFRNLGHGHFADVTDKFFSPQDLDGDKHGAMWADFNNDGREDLVQLRGAKAGIGSEPKRLFLNTGSKFVNVAEKMGVSNPWGRSRMPLWYDFNNDGLLDLFQGAESRLDDRTPPFTFIQKNGKFIESEALKFKERGPILCVDTVLKSDMHRELICRIVSPDRASRIFDTATIPARELPDLLPQTAYEDIAAADFDNDGRIDLFLARKNPAGAVAYGRLGSKEFIADLMIDQADVDKPTGFAFRSSGKLTYRVFPAWGGGLTADQIRYGKQGIQPGNFTFALSAKTPGVEGTPINSPGKQSGVYVGMTSPDKWDVQVTVPHEAVTGNNKTKYREIQIRVTSSEPIEDFETIGAPLKHEEAPARLFMNRDGKLVEEGDKRGVNARLVSAVNVVAGDFNNDMHVDLFVVVSDEIGKKENLLLLNRGDGHFDVVSNAGGAAGSLTGVGDSVTTVDYDRDGFLDLLITTGGSMGRSEGLPSDGGAYHLYHNIGNGNHWIEIDLEGTKSNRDGIGALVNVVAGGVTQVRVQDGGLHRRGQNFQRLHFGLAKYTQIDKLTVHWPSGVVQELRGVKADQILRIKEPGP